MILYLCKKNKEKKMKTRNKEKRIYIYKIIVTIIFALLVMFVLHIAQNYIRNEISDKTNLVINNNNVTKSLKNDVIIENEIVFMHKDIQTHPSYHT